MTYQWVIIRDNCESYVVWAETKQAALDEFHDKGYHDEWRILRKRAERPNEQIARGY